jgi:DNA invertase Pin-like site-specific DNA recombinase
MTTKTSKRVALYARVSTDEQTAENQLRELREVAERHRWDVVAEYVDQGISGAKGRDARPQFDALLRAVTRRKFDMVAVWSVDRLGRSLTNLLEFMLELQAKDVGLYLHQQALDTSTPAGRAMFQMCGVFAEFERAMIVERVNAGLARARAKGVALGRPMGNYRPDQKGAVEQRIRDLRAKEMGKGKIARTLGVGVSVVQRVLSA